MTPTTHCFHCGDEFSTEQAPTLVTIDGHAREFCSGACARIGRLISARGLDDFYRFRTDPAGRVSGTATHSDWTSYDRAGVQREFVAAEDDGSHRAQFLLEGVHCAACVWLIESAVAPLDGVLDIAVDPVTTRTNLHWASDRIPLSQIFEHLSALGFTPVPYTQDAAEAARRDERRQALRRLAVAGLGMMQVMSFAVALYLGAWSDPAIGEYLRLISLLVATPVVLYAGAPFFRSAWLGIRTRSLGMDVPVALAIGGAWSASVYNTFTGQGEVYFDSATMFVFFLTGARYLEMAGRHRALSLSAALSTHVPRVAHRLRGAVAETVGTLELETGDQILVHPGQAVPADGRLRDRRASVHESLLTGESTPVAKRQGDQVIAGSVNGGQPIHLTVTATGANTVLAQISGLSTTAAGNKPRLVATADRIARYFVAAVLCIAGATYAGWYGLAPERAFEVALSVLVVTCPCALALATPAVFTVATSALAGRGLLLRQPGALQAMSEVTSVVFDKTGTLTGDEIALAQVELFGALDEQQALAIASALESRSEHPIARAFAQSTATAEISDFNVSQGAGVEARVDGQTWRIGSYAYVDALTAAETSCAGWQETGDQRYVYLGSQEGLAARFALTERPRPGADEVVERLSALGLELQIASGDTAGPVQRLAHSLGIAQYHAGLKPEDKLEFLHALQARGERALMVGDGINDSPVLAGADVSIAMGAGTALARHTADSVLLGNSLLPVADALETSRRAMGIVRQNLTWAIGYNLLAVPLAATGMLAPWMAALGMSASSLLVTGNALRLGRAPAAPASKTASTSSCCATRKSALPI